jgi:D-psicose/D-tagatose/L-ribulose 3-epimerase
LIDHARRLGFAAFEISLVNLPQVNPASIRRRAEAVGIEVIGTLALSKGRVLATADEGTRREAIALLKDAVTRVREMGGRLLGGMMYAVPGYFTGQGPTQEEMKWLVDGLREAAVFAREQEVRLAIEPVNRYETYLVNTAAQAQLLVDEIGEPNVGLTLDTYHMNIEERNIPATIRQHAASLFHLHFGESDRGTVGGGNIVWPAVFAALRDIDYPGMGTLESFDSVSPEVPACTPVWRKLFPSPDEFACSGLAFLQKQEKDAK